MTENVIGAVEEEVDNVHIASKVNEDDNSLAMVDQAVDAMIASSQIIDEYLPKIKADSVPQQASIDIVKDLMETAIKPYLADIATAMRVVGE